LSRNCQDLVPAGKSGSATQQLSPARRPDPLRVNEQLAGCPENSRNSRSGGLASLKINTCLVFTTPM
jgi:hypothetical protein